MSEILLSELGLVADAFHFLRPLFLLLLVPLAALWWMNRRAATREPPLPEGIAPHLLAALTVGGGAARRFLPIDHVSALLALAVIGAAGPSWTRQADPFLAQTGPVVIVLEVTPSMTTPDLAPSRLERAKFKIRDLLDLRAGARTALVAYAGTAHRVLPFTEDAQVMLPYLEGLTPDVMPQEGANATAALSLAQEILAAEGVGGVLVVADGLDSADVAAFDSAGAGAATTVLAMLPDGVSDIGLDRLGTVPVVRATTDDSDVQRLDRILNVDYRRALLDDDSQPWEDRGWWLAVPAVLLALLWFRQGWTMRWGALCLVASVGLNPGAARADGLADWFLTPDQQGYRAFNRNDFTGAGDLFADPMWKGHALYRAGRYDEAIEVLNRLETPEASFTQGLAHIKNRQYRDGVRAFETTLERDPDFPGAAENLETARRIVTYVEDAREASDTGEETGIGADDVVFDNEANRGVDTQTDRQPRGEEAILTSDQWMNTVDTRTGDFLRYRFRFEASGAGQ
ncbi:VWA domain-containing protein [Ruegeria pomeroyi]|nr:VWA domain-containing protein [Ruegeria pomeroyi]